MKSAIPWRTAGSSPRGRGKPEAGRPGREQGGLIPAWAGKTKRAVWSRNAAPAHPRVGGENRHALNRPVQGMGSSPRGRGKPCDEMSSQDPSRLIPAWAGKTGQHGLTNGRKPAHPRVGGENRAEAEFNGGQPGSSPRGRGKHFLTCAITTQSDQILEILGLSVSSESYSFWDACATDAPQGPAQSIGLAPPSSRGAS